MGGNKLSGIYSDISANGQSLTMLQTVTACDSYTWNGVTYTTSGT